MNYLKKNEKENQWDTVKAVLNNKCFNIKKKK